MNTKIYNVVEKIGRAGSAAKREQIARQWNSKFGEGNWTVGYVFEEHIYDREDALEKFFNTSYLEYMRKNPKIVNNLINSAKELFNPHAVFTTGVDLQVPAVMYALKELGLTLKGTQKIPIGSFQPKFWGDRQFEIAKEFNLLLQTKDGKTKIKYPQVTYDLSPYTVPFIYNKDICIEDFWQNYKYLLKINK